LKEIYENENEAGWSTKDIFDSENGNEAIWDMTCIQIKNTGKAIMLLHSMVY
jgi:hypothetical protein